MPHLKGRRKVHRRHLAPDGFHDLRPGVTGVHAPQACTPVEDLAAFGGPVIHALGTLKQARRLRSEEHTSELQSHLNLVCRLLLEKKKHKMIPKTAHVVPLYI